MKKIFFAILVSIILSVVPITVPKPVLITLYGVVGIFFSVGMSLVISFNAGNIQNTDYRNEIRGGMHQIRQNFILIFTICSILYTAYFVLGDKQEAITTSIQITKTYTCELCWSLSLLAFLAYSVFAILSNYIDIQSLYEDIEDRIIQENKRQKKLTEAK